MWTAQLAAYKTVHQGLGETPTGMVPGAEQGAVCLLVGKGAPRTVPCGVPGGEGVRALG